MLTAATAAAPLPAPSAGTSPAPVFRTGSDPTSPVDLSAGSRILQTELVFQAIRTGTAFASTPNHSVYLALGDSIAFGFVPGAGAAAQGMVGYPTEVAGQLSQTVVNASCPGQTSAGFISAGGNDNGCGAFRAAQPLHVGYTGTQLDFAVGFLRSHPDTGLVTLGIGANDLLLCMRSTPDKCARELAATLQRYRTDLTTILQRLRAVYNGELVLVNYYSPSYHDPKATAAFKRLDKVMAKAAHSYGAGIADTFASFAAASARYSGNNCAAGLLIKLPHQCNIHPTPSGRRLLATVVTNAARASAR